MKKLLIFFVFILGITMFLGAVSALCTDTDGGKDIYKNGEIHFISPYAQPYDTGIYIYDSCSNDILYERYCGANGSTIETEEMTCPSGYKCEIDKCIQNDERYTPDIEGNCSNCASSPGGGGGQGGGCYDTDGGKDIYKKGIAAGVYDSCISKYRLSERYCTNSQGADNVVDCPIGYLCSDGACTQNSNDDRQENTTTTPTTTYFKTCTYVWDSSPYVNQAVKITASINDSKGARDSDSVDVRILSQVSGGGGGGGSMDGKTLQLQITEPASGDIGAGATGIKISAKGPNELGDISLSLTGDNWGAGFPISNKNCVSGGSGGGGSGGSISSGTSTSCEKYYKCSDEQEVQYCQLIKQYDANGNVIGAGCGCKTNPESLCTAPSSGGGGGGSSQSNVIPIPSSGGSGGSGNNETPVLCNGCVLGDKCVPIGFRKDAKYCDLTSELIEQKTANSVCENSFECDSNLCVDNKCVSGSVWAKFMRWFSRLFGGN